MNDWVVTDYDERTGAEQWENTKHEGWFLYSQPSGFHLWWKFQYIGQFESLHDAADHVRAAENVLRNS